MKIGILGPLTISGDNDAPLAIALEPKQEIVLVALAANADRGVPVRELVLALHGASDVILYKRSVESVVSRLRTSLKNGGLDADSLVPPGKGGFYRLRIPEAQIDALRFLRQAEQLLNNWSTVSTAEQQRLSVRAIREWRADPARVYAAASPIAPDVFRRFTSVLAELGDRYCRLLLQEQRFDQARRELNRLVELLPDHAPFVRLHDEVVSHSVRAAPLPVSLNSARPRAGSALAELRDRIVASRALHCDVVTVSAHNLDRIYLVDRVAADHEVKIDRAWEAPGGSGANTVAALARLGCTVAAAGVVADDAEGRTLLDALSSAGVECSNILMVAASETVRSGHSVIFSDRHGVRSIYVHPGVNELFAETVAATPGALDRLQRLVESSRIVHFTSFTSPAELGLQEQLAGLLPAESILSLNPGALYSSLGLDRLDPMLSRVNVLFLYEQNLRELVQNSAAPLVEVGEHGMRADLNRLYAWKKMKGYDQPLVTLVKRFRSSVSGTDESEYLTIASGRFGVEEIVGSQARILRPGRVEVQDSTGAGDGMAAALHFCLLRGASLRECADVSFLIAAMVSERVGARSGHPVPDALRDAWRDLFSGVPEPPALGGEPAARVPPLARGQRFL